jgi:hypothetical protein
MSFGFTEKKAQDYLQTGLFRGFWKKKPFNYRMLFNMMLKKNTMEFVNAKHILFLQFNIQ